MGTGTQALFVYGTLRQGFPLHGYLRKRGARLLGKGTISAKLFDLGRYPGAVPSSSPGDVVEGELYELRDPLKQFKELDDLEEFYPNRPSESLFVRRKTTVFLGARKRARAWAYFLARMPKNGKRIPQGNYAAA